MEENPGKTKLRVLSYTPQCAAVRSTAFHSTETSILYFYI